MRCSFNSCVYMNRRSEIMQLLVRGEKAVYVSKFNTKTTIHIRRFFGDNDKKLLTRFGFALAKQVFVELGSLSNVILAEYERQGIHEITLWLLLLL